MGYSSGRLGDAAVRAARLILAGGLVLAMALMAGGCSDSKAKRFWGQWVMDAQQTKAANKVDLEGEKGVAVAISLGVFKQVKVKITKQAMEIDIAGKARSMPYQVEGDSLIATFKGQNLLFRLLEDGKYLLAENLTSKESALRVIVMVKGEG